MSPEKRVKCIKIRPNIFTPPDPYLKIGTFYMVIDEQVHTLADETPYIRIYDHVSRMQLERPRHLFGKVLTND